MTQPNSSVAVPEPGMNELVGQLQFAKTEFTLISLMLTGASAVVYVYVIRTPMADILVFLVLKVTVAVPLSPALSARVGCLNATSAVPPGTAAWLRVSCG